MLDVDESYICDISVVNMPVSMAFLEETEGFEVSKIEEDNLEAVKESIKEDESDLLVIFPADFARHND